MKTLIEMNGRLTEIPRGELGRCLHQAAGAVRVTLIPETLAEVQEQVQKAAKAAEARRSYAMHVNRPSQRTKEAFFKNVRRQDGPMSGETASWRYDDVLIDCGVKPIF